MNMGSGLCSRAQHVGTHAVPLAFMRCALEMLPLLITKLRDCWCRIRQPFLISTVSSTYIFIWFSTLVSTQVILKWGWHLCFLPGMLMWRKIWLSVLYWCSYNQSFTRLPICPMYVEPHLSKMEYTTFLSQCTLLQAVFLCTDQLSTSRVYTGAHHSETLWSRKKHFNTGPRSLLVWSRYRPFGSFKLFEHFFRDRWYGEDNSPLWGDRWIW